MTNKIKKLKNFSKTLKVLYVEDNADARKQTLKLLNNFFNEIIIAENGLDGLEKFKKYNPDIIFTDINMPHLNGISMLSKIKKINEQIVCIIISAHNEADYLIDAIKEGVDGFILKPIELRQFTNLVYKMVEKIRLEKEEINYKKNLEAAVEEKTKTLSYKLYHDNLTGLLNRNALLEKISKCDEKNIPVVFIIDIDNFKIYNELYGTEIANEILRQFALLIKQYSMSKNLSSYRIFGDEFAMFEGVQYIDIHKYEDIVYNLLDFLSTHKIFVESLGEHLEINITIGMALGNSNALYKANIALINAKSTRRKFCAYSTQIDRSDFLKNSIYWKKEIKKAIQEDRVIPYFQSIVDRSGKTVKYESLMRIEKYDDEGNKQIITPFVFLDIAKQTKQYDKLSYGMIKKTFKLMRGRNISFSINLDYTDIYNQSIMNMIESYLHEISNSSENKSLLIFEILENEQIKDYQTFSKKLHGIKKLGGLLAIDDFGSGYSNLSHIVGIGPKYIKIDAALVKDINTNVNAKKIIQGIVQLAKNLNMKTIAEYVATKEIFDTVYELGVDEFQGYFFGKPMPIEKIKTTGQKQ